MKGAVPVRMPAPPAMFLPRLISILLLAQGIQGPLAAQNLADITADQYQTTFEDRRSGLAKDLKAKRAALLSRYAEALSKVRQKYQEAGKLEEALFVDAEMKAAQEGLFSATPAQGPGDGKPPPAALLDMRRTAEVELQKLDAEARLEFSALCSFYIKALEKLKVTLTQTGKLDEAITVTGEIGRAAGLAASPNGLRDTSASRTPLTDAQKAGLVLFYAFEERDEDGVIKDSSPEGNDGHLEGRSALVQEGMIGGARSFAGRDSRVVPGHALPDSAEITVCVWVKCSDPVRGGGLLSDYGPANANDLFLSLKGPSSIYVRADKAGLPLNALIPLGKPLTKDWHHLAWTMSRTTTTLYVDGLRAGEVAQGGANVDHHRNFFIGSANNGQETTHFTGELDEFMIWNRVLTEAEVTGIFLRADPPP